MDTSEPEYGFCRALHFEGERVSREKQFITACCVGGEGTLEPSKPTLSALRSLVECSTPQARQCRKDIHKYNSALAFNSGALPRDEKQIRLSTSQLEINRISTERYSGLYQSPCGSIYSASKRYCGGLCTVTIV